MKKTSRQIASILGVAAGALFLNSCHKSADSPGYEYMPDMYRSPAIEAYVDYSNLEEQSAKLPPAGTIPFKETKEEAAINMPYTLEATPEGYTQSAAFTVNPIAINAENAEAVLAEGQDIYMKFCSHCHGENGDGQGKLVQNEKILGVPNYANKKELSNGTIFHVITHGKGNMGSHASQLSKEERWKIVHYIRSMQFENYPTLPVEEVEKVAEVAQVQTAEATPVH